MSRINIKCNLTAKGFIPLSSDFSRTIVPLKSSGINLEEVDSIPQVYYVQDCLPTRNGYSAINYTLSAPSPSGALTSFKNAFHLLDSASIPYYYFPQDSATQYIYAGGTWRTPSVAGSLNGKYSFAHVRQQSYICYPGNGIYTYAVGTNTLTKETLLGVTESGIRGNLAAKGYHILYTDDSIYWSSILNPLDFVPSLSTGAGTGKVQDIRGKIQTILPIRDGFIIYAERNAVSATFSGNLQFPWIFKEVEGSAGILSSDHVSYEANLPSHLVWSVDAGFMEISKTKAEPIWPELTDFIRSKVIESFSMAVPSILTTTYSGQINLKLAAINSRYLCVSYYSPTLSNEFERAVIYDVALQRWSRITRKHVDIILYSNSILGQNSSFLFSLVEKNGNIYSVETIEWQDAASPTLLSNPAILLGKYGMYEDNFLTLLEASVDSSFPATRVFSLSSIHNKVITTTTELQALPEENTKETKKYLSFTVGRWFSLLITGPFALSNVTLTGIVTKI